MGVSEFVTSGYLSTTIIANVGVIKTETYIFLEFREVLVFDVPCEIACVALNSINAVLSPHRIIK